MAILYKLIYKFYVIPITIPAAFFFLHKSINVQADPKMCMGMQGTQSSQNNREKRWSKLEDSQFPHLKTHYKATVSRQCYTGIRVDV